MTSIGHYIGASGAVALAASLVLAPASTGRASAATSRAAMAAMLAATPSTTNRSGVVTVTGSGFAPNESVTLALSGMSGTAAVAKANATGVIPPTGISIPYSLTPGAYTITATGATSKHSGSVKITVARLTPSVAISAASTAPGATETVTGKGFGAQEQITLSLNGEALPTAPSVITTTHGAFSASFAVPKSVLSGANAISAIGNESRVSAIATLNGQLTRSAQFYFAGAINTVRDHSYVTLLNANRQPASVRLTFYFDNGSSYTRLTTVPATTPKRISVADFNLPEGRYGLEVKADRQIAAQISTLRDGQDGDVMLGNTGLGATWYLAAGSTGGSYQERVSILNIDAAQPAHVQLQLVPAAGQQGKTVMVTVPAHTNGVTNINAVLPNQAASIIATSDRPVVVARSLTFGPNGRGLTLRAGSNKPATNWLFADATTQNGVRTVFTILNPAAVPAMVTASFSRGQGITLGSRSMMVAPHSRATLNAGDVVQGGGLATVLTSNQPVVVERAEYIGAPDAAMAGSVVVGRNGAAARWTFPGGNTTVPNDEVLDLYNPSSTVVPIDATFYNSDGRVVSRQYTLGPTARVIIPVNTLGLSELHAAVLQATNGQGFIAEQGTSRRDSQILRSTQGLAQ